MKNLVVLGAWIAMSSPAWAAMQTVTLSVPDMHCAACPITVKKALTQVAGVRKADVSLDRHEARVTFDDTKTNADALTRATTDAGYPATVEGKAR